MSRPPSNKLRATASLAVLVASFAGCAHQQSATSTESAAPIAGANKVGYVRMDALVKVHPLYTQLARLDEDVEALQLKSVGTQIARSGADIRSDERALQKELEQAADRTKKALTDKQNEYAKREQAAIDAALGSVRGAGNASGTQIENGVAQRAGQQAQRASAAAQSNFNAYRSQVIDQDQQAARSLQRSLAERATRQYRARAEELQKKEADFALQQASEDAADRLSLHTKLSNLALDDSSRADVKKQLDVIEQKESDALGAMRNRDQATLAALQKQLHDDVRGELTAQVAALRKRTIAKINEREIDTRKQLTMQIGVPRTGVVAVPNGLAPDMRAKLEALHKQYQTDFNKDASQTIAEFVKTKADLTQRFRKIADVDAGAQAGAGGQIDALRRQRGDLYSEMVAQIGREVKVIAQRRGINVVVSEVVAPAGGVDLTAEAQKDIESLHE
ncbi:MAG: hypothetical protein IAI50_07895 [Candidatus Eremiobacteraeota bacterium]|nr:hypothetical protein [Candidatus Eremiobacteraeota bacterium]